MTTASAAAAAAAAPRRALPVADAPATEPRADHDAHWLATEADLAPYAAATAPPDTAFGRRVWAFAEALFATEAGAPPPSRLAWLCAEVADLVERAGPRGGATFRLALWFVTWFAPLLAGRLPPLSRVPVAERAALLDRFEHGALPQTGAIMVLKAMLCMIWFEHPDSAREIGFDARCLGASSSSSPSLAPEPRT